jgi:uncharacterized protein
MERLDETTLRQQLRDMLSRHHTVTLATVGAGEPWAATVFFASDADLRLYFVTDPRTRHGADLAGGSPVAAAVNADPASWDDIRGVQLRGHAATVTGERRAAALALYLHKFPDVARLFREPRNESEQRIAARLQSTAFWCLTPRWLRLLDSQRGFGWKQELAPPAGSA